MNEYERNIIETVYKARRPVSTNEVAEKAKISWNTAKKHLERLEEKNKVKSRSKGTKKEWILDTDKENSGLKQDTMNEIIEFDKQFLQSMIDKLEVAKEAEGKFKDTKIAEVLVHLKIETENLSYEEFMAAVSDKKTQGESQQ